MNRYGLNSTQEARINTLGAAAWAAQAAEHILRGEYALARRAMRYAAEAAQDADALLAGEGIDVASDAAAEAAQLRGAFDR